MNTPSIVGVGLHPDAVAEKGAAGDGARRIDRDDPDRTLGPSDLRDERRDQRRLARSGRPGDPDQVGTTRRRVEPAHRDLRDGAAVLDRRQQSGCGQSVTGQRGLDQRIRPRSPGASPTLVARPCVRPQVVRDLGDRGAGPEDRRTRPRP